MRKFSEEEYRKAALKWRQDHPGKTIPSTAMIVTEEGKTIKIGQKIATLKNKYDKLSAEEKAFWEKFGVRKREKYVTVEEYKEGAKLWLKNHEGTDIKISKKMPVVLENGREINLANHLAVLRKNYQNLSLEEKEFWRPFHIDLSLSELHQKDFEKALEIWKSENPDEHVPEKTVITLESGKKINLGKHLMNQKTKENLSSLNKKVGKRREFSQEEYFEAAQLWKEQNPSFDHIPRAAVITISSGKEIPIGYKAGRVQYDYENLKEEEKEFWRNMIRINDTKVKKEKEIEEKINQLGMTKKEQVLALYKKYYDEYGGNEARAKYVVNCLAKLPRPQMDMSIVLQKIAHDEKSAEKLNCFRKVSKEGKNLIIPEDKNLKTFIEENHFQTLPIVKLVRLSQFCPEDTLDGLIDRVLIAQKKRRTEPDSWISSYYGNHIMEILKYLNLSKEIIVQMNSEIIPIEEAITHSIWKKKRVDSKQQWLKEVCLYIMKSAICLQQEVITKEYYSSLVSYFCKKCELKKEDHILLREMILEIVPLIKEFQKVEIAYEPTLAGKVEKMKRYQLTEGEIEESFFLPIELWEEQGQLQEKKRRIEQYSIDWNIYSKEEKQEIIRKEKLTLEEVSQIERMRMKIDYALSERKQGKSKMLMKKM